MKKIAILAAAALMIAASAFAQFGGPADAPCEPHVDERAGQLVDQMVAALYADMSPDGRQMFLQTLEGIVQTSGNDPDALSEACAEQAGILIGRSDDDSRRLGMILFHIAIVNQGATPDMIVDGLRDLARVLDENGHRWHRSGNFGAFLGQYV